MLRLIAPVLVLAVLTGCGTAPATRAPLAPAAMSALAKADPFAKLLKLTVNDGAPSDGYKKAKRHLAAQTAKKGQLWILDMGDSVAVLHNTQTVTDAKKLATLANALRTAALELENDKDKNYVFVIAQRIEWSIPGVR